MQFVISYAAAAATFFVLDMIWLAGLAKGFYFGRLAGYVRDRADVVVAGCFYLGYIAGVVFFAVAPAVREGSVATAGVYGALLGLLCYGTYDLTNLATLKNWPRDLAIVDMIWGTFLTAAAAVAGAWSAMKFAG